MTTPNSILRFSGSSSRGDECVSGSSRLTPERESLSHEQRLRLQSLMSGAQCVPAQQRSLEVSVEETGARPATGEFA